MLVLSRKVGQTIKIGDQVSITVTAVNGKLVKLGLDAPKEINIVREEISDKLDSTTTIKKSVG